MYVPQVSDDKAHEGDGGQATSQKVRVRVRVRVRAVKIPYRYTVDVSPVL